MNYEKIRTYDELEDEEKEVLDSFRKMKLMYDHARNIFFYKINCICKTLKK